MTSSRVEIGYVARAHGIRGELRVTLHDPESRALARARSVWLDGRAHELIAARSIDGGWLVAVAGITDRGAAEALRGVKLEVDRQVLGLGDGEVLIADLVGCRLELRDGTAWGEVAEIALGPQTLLVVHDGAIERLVPLVGAIVVSIDVAARRIVVDPPEGLPETPRR